MRCIEMAMDIVWLFIPKAINRNMRCIEIRQPERRHKGNSWINRNMRCIEIRFGLR